MKVPSTIDEQDIQIAVDELGGSNICRKAGLGNLVRSYYIGVDLEPNVHADFDDVSDELELSRQEILYWENLFYDKNSWFNCQ